MQGGEGRGGRGIVGIYMSGLRDIASQAGTAGLPGWLCMVSQAQYTAKAAFSMLITG